MSKPKKPKVLDLFSGWGGFSLGLEAAGFETAAFCEIDECCCEDLQQAWPNTKIYKDVTKLKGEEIIENHGEIFAICGGFPCQDVSVAGRKRGFKDEQGKRTRSGLWSEYKRLIKEIRPRFVIIENVANLRNLGLNQVIKDLWSIGYVGEWHIIPARAIGACHLRERVWIIAHADGDRRGKSLPLQAGNEGKSLQLVGDGTKGPSPYADHFRLGIAFASAQEKYQWWAKATACFGGLFGKIFETQPSIRKGDDGFSFGLAPEKLERFKAAWARNVEKGFEPKFYTRPRNNDHDAWIERRRKFEIRALGNAVVPQIPELIGKSLIASAN